MPAVVEHTRPRLAEGVEILGEYAGSGYKQPHYMVRRGDGQVIQLSHLLHLVAGAVDGERDTHAVAERVSEQLDRRLTGEQVEQLLTAKLRPLGLLAGEGDEPRHRLTPLLRLRLRTKALPASAVQRLAIPFRPLFVTPVVAVVLAGWVAMLYWLFVLHGLGDGLREAIQRPAVFLLVLALVITSAAFHEFGHAAACAYGGATPGVIGAGVYLAWPAFYTDVTDAYRLGRRGRLRTDLGGVYFNIIFSLGTLAGYAVTRYEPLLLVVTLQQVEMIHQLLPLVRLDGYYILADLTGVPDLFRRVRPILTSAVPWHRTDAAAAELKPWVRAVVTVWVLLVVPLLMFNLVTVVLYLPRMIATGWQTAQTYGRSVAHAVHDTDVVTVIVDVIHMIALAIPLIGIALTLLAVGRRIVTKISQRPVLRAVAAAGVVAFALYALRPDGDYTPLQAGERLTIGDVVSAVATGHAAPPATAPPTPAPAPRSPAGDTPSPPHTPSTQAQRPRSDLPRPPVTATPAIPATPGLTVPPLPAVTAPPAPLPTVHVPAVTVAPLPVTVPAVTVPQLPPPPVPAVTVPPLPVTVPAVTVPPLPG